MTILSYVHLLERITVVSRGTTVSEIVQLRGNVGGDLFCQKDGLPLTQYQFWTVTSQGVKKAGIVGWKFGTHSFRISAASTAAALGYCEDQIKKLGRWSSCRFKTYVRSLPQ